MTVAFKNSSNVASKTIVSDLYSRQNYIFHPLLSNLKVHQETDYFKVKQYQTVLNIWKHKEKIY